MPAPRSRARSRPSLRGRRWFAALGLLAAACSGPRACGTEAQRDTVAEDEPARPCSVNGMLFRDTPDTDFRRCGRSRLPIDGEVADCVREASEAEQPFVVELAFPGVGPQRRPALVGAHFDGEYALRTYVSRTDQSGERTPVELVIPRPGSRALATMATQLRPFRCQLSAKAPPGDDWEVNPSNAEGLINRAQCREWFDERAWRRSPWNSSFAAGAVLRCGEDPLSGSLDDDVRRYVGDPEYRRGVLERDLTDRDALYARIRLARYSRDGDDGWEQLPVRRWSTAAFTVDDAELMAEGGQVARGFEYEGFDDLDPDDPDTWPTTQAGWVALGERVFFEVPFAYSPPAGRALRQGKDLRDYGFLVHEGTFVGLRMARHDDRPAHLAITCAVCHASIDDSGRPSAVRANRAYDFGRLRLDVRADAHEGGVDVTRTEDLGRLGPGRSDVQHDDAFNPYAFPDLGGIRDVPFLHHTANWRHQGTATMAIRVETVFTRGGPRGWRPPRVLMWALAEYFRSLPPPPPVRDPDELSEAGEAVFGREDCDLCHVPPGFTADAPVDLEAIGTDADAGTSRARGTGTWRVPSLRGVGGNAPYLHHGAFASLEDMFAPGRAATEPGHEFGLDLDDQDRAALLAYLRTI